MLLKWPENVNFWRKLKNNVIFPEKKKIAHTNEVSPFLLKIKNGAPSQRKSALKQANFNPLNIIIFTTEIYGRNFFV